MGFMLVLKRCDYITLHTGSMDALSVGVRGRDSVTLTLTPTVREFATTPTTKLATKLAMLRP